MIYSNMLKPFAKKYKIIAVDLPCFGKSGTPKDVWDFRDYAAFLNKFVASLKIKKLIVMGHSFGGGHSKRQAGDGAAFPFASSHFLVRRFGRRRQCAETR